MVIRSCLCWTLLSLLILICLSYTIQTRIQTRNLSTRLHAGADFNDDDVSVGRTRHLRISARSSLIPLNTKAADDDNDKQQLRPFHTSCDRRQALGTLVSIGTVVPVSSTVTLQSSYDIDCLAKLPPLPSHCVRIYLCRHGQTEFNRLKIVQSGRVNPPINSNGRAQAERLGQTLSRALTPPDTIVHSLLLRAQQTAETAASQYGDDHPALEVLPSLTKVDFGSLEEGDSVEEYRGTMADTYSAWAVGDLNARMDGGESGQELFVRVEETLQALAEKAEASQSRCIAAVTHSSYLRILLATVQNMSLLDASKILQKNCCVNVLDMKRGSTRELTAQSTLLGGHRSHAPPNFNLTIPMCKLIRVNEYRHLGVIAT